MKRILITEAEAARYYGSLTIYGKIAVANYVLSLTYENEAELLYSTQFIQSFNLIDLLQFIRRHNNLNCINLYPRFLSLVTACSYEPYICFSTKTPFLVNNALSFINQFRNNPILWDDICADFTLIFDVSRTVFDSDILFPSFLKSLSCLIQAIKWTHERDAVTRYHTEKVPHLFTDLQTYN